MLILGASALAYESILRKHLLDAVDGAYSCRHLRLGPAILSHTVLMLNLSEYVRDRDLGGEEKQNSNRKDFLKR